jgi:hypothetical protein
LPFFLFCFVLFFFVFFFVFLFFCFWLLFILFLVETWLQETFCFEKWQWNV